MNAFDNAYSGGTVEDAFVVRVNAAGSALVYSTYLSGNFGARGCGIAANNNQGLRLCDRHDQHQLSSNSECLRIHKFQLWLHDQAMHELFRCSVTRLFNFPWPTRALLKAGLSQRTSAATFI